MAARSGDMKAVQTIYISNPLSINSKALYNSLSFLLHLGIAALEGPLRDWGFCENHSENDELVRRKTLLGANMIVGPRTEPEAWSGQAQVVSYLCKNMADVRAAAMDDMGAIHSAAQKDHLEVVRILLSSGVSVEAVTRKGMTPLHYAVQGSHLELVKYLLKKEANPTAKTKPGKTPLDLASSEEVRSLLVDHEKSSEREDLNGKDKIEGSDLNPPPEGKAEITCDGAGFVASHEEEVDDEQNDETLKRKNGEDQRPEITPQSKKEKVALSHLLVEDDAQDEENE
ncbi:Ankyrin repeat [Dillenia turbinata]|uniref:Ankyrin repeat n=1 Tax=Dillenia turbinata TaxID=194707 RepID=A0AAN8W8U0_9MAGN